MIQKAGNRIKAVFTEDGFTSSNSIVVEDDVNLMIDSGAGKILSEINLAGIDILVNSHRHLDHIWGNALLPQAKVLMHPLEEAALSDPFKIAAIEGWPSFMEEDVFKEAGVMGSIPDKLSTPFQVDGPLAEGDVIDCGRTNIEVLLTPGHTSGHCSFSFPEEGLIFMADVCLSAVGPWYGEPEADIDAFMQTIDRIISMKPEAIVTGHRSEVLRHDIPAVLTEYRDRMTKREQRIWDFIRGTPATVNDLAEKKFIYPDHPTIFILFWERAMVKKHLDRLIKRGLALRLEDGRYEGRA